MNNDIYGNKHVINIYQASTRLYCLTLSQITNLRLFQIKSVKTIVSYVMKKVEVSNKSVENAVGKREIACYYQFLLLPQIFQKACTADK